MCVCVWYTSIYVSICVSICTRTHTHAHARTHTTTHTHTHTKTMARTLEKQKKTELLFWHHILPCHQLTLKKHTQKTELPFWHHISSWQLPCHELLLRRWCLSLNATKLSSHPYTPNPNAGSSHVTHCLCVAGA